MENGEQGDHLNWVIVVVPGEEERGVGWEVFKKKKKKGMDFRCFWRENPKNLLIDSARRVRTFDFQEEE